MQGGRRGDRAVAVARELAASEAVQLVLVSVIPHARNAGCTMSAEPLNDAVESAARADLADAAARLGDPACARVVLRERVDPSLAEWATASGVTSVLLPRRATRAARALARAGIDVRAV